MDAKQLNDAGRAMWNNKASFWDALHGDDGNEFHRTLVSPSVERLLNLQAGERVLDIGCGNGVLARRLATLGGDVTASDFSAELITRAKKRGQTSGTPIEYKIVDATDENALRALGENSFKAVTCTMALMDMPVIAPLFRAVNRLLDDGGRFVFANMHPAFNSNNPIFMIEKGDKDGELYTEYALKLREYLHMPPVKGVGAADEPNPHYYYHRPLHEILNTAFEAGLVMDGIEEPAFPRSDAPDQRPTWASMWQFPPVLTARLSVG